MTVGRDALSLAVAHRGPVTLIELRGAIGTGSVSDLERVLRAFVTSDESPSAARTKEVVIDLAGVGAIADECLQLMLDLRAAVGAAGGRLSFRSVVPELRRRFEAAGVPLPADGSDGDGDAIAAAVDASAASELLAITLDDLSATAARVLDVDASSVTVVRQGRPETIAASAPWSGDLDAVQYAAGDGPCLAATRSGTVTRIGAVAGDRRWPTFADAAIRAGVIAVLSMPISTPTGVVGALNLYSRTPRLPDEDEAADLAATAARAVALAPIVDSTRSRVWFALESRRRIALAQGALMEREELRAEDAYRLLADRARANGVRIEDEAAAVLQSIAERAASKESGHERG